MTSVMMPEPLRTDLLLRRDLPQEDVLGFLADLWREAEGSDVGLMFADWLEDHGDARCQPVRWSLLSEQAYTDDLRTAYRERMSDWWGRYGRGWVGPMATNVPIYWHHGCLSSRIEASFVPGEGPVLTSQRVRSLQQAPWLGRVELGHVRTESLLHDLGPHLHALALRGCVLSSLSALSRLPNLMQVSLQEYVPAHLELTELGVVQLVEVLAPDALTTVTLSGLPDLRRIHLQECQDIAEFYLSDVARLRTLNLGEQAALRDVRLRSLPALESLTLPTHFSGTLLVEDCPALPPEMLAQWTRRRVWATSASAQSKKE